MAPVTKKSGKVKSLTAAQLRRKATQFLKSKKNANSLTEILAMFNEDTQNYVPVLLTVEMIFTELLRRKDMYEVVKAEKTPAVLSMAPEAVHLRWLREGYELALTSIIACMKKGYTESRVQALVTACKLMREEGLNPMESSHGFVSFPHIRLKNILDALLDYDELSLELINRFQEYAEYCDIQQYGLKMISLMQSCKKNPTLNFMQNYLELFDKLMSNGLPSTPRSNKERHKDDRYYCEKEGKVPFHYNPDLCRCYVNRCWGTACKWPLRATLATHHRSLVVLVDRIMPYLSRPQMATDLLMDSLDCSPVISTLAFRGMLELVTKHRINYPDIYDRLYAMYEPELFATRSKRRLLRLTNVFLSSTRISEALVAAFAKRLSRLALIASPGDARDLLSLIANLVARHRGLRGMLARSARPAVMPKDPYVMEESSAASSRAMYSSLWEVDALKLHFTPEVCASARRVFDAANGTLTPEEPVDDGNEQFEIQVAKRFKSIETNFVRYPGFEHLTQKQQVQRYWDF